MSRAFNIFVPSPPGWTHGPLFMEIAELLQLSLQSLGHAAKVMVNTFDADMTNIVLGHHMFDDPYYLKQAPCIVYQLEQLPAADESLREKWLAALKQAPAVWDYSVENIAALCAGGVNNVRHVAFGFHPALRRITHATDKDIDVLFYGAVSPRRKRLLDVLGTRCKAVVMTGYYGRQRDELIARAKVVLNMHQDEAMILEQPRVSYLLNNECFVVSEESRDTPYAGLVSVPYDRLIDTCLHYIERPEERQRLASQAAASFRQMEMRRIVESALQS